MKKITGIFQIKVGICMISVWILLFLTESIPEIRTEPYRIAAHISAEFITGILLIFSGTGILLNQPRLSGLYKIALGMLLYTLIASPGYYMQAGDSGMTVIFSLLMIITVFLIFQSVKKGRLNE